MNFNDVKINWSNNDTSRYYWVRKKGIYWIEVSDVSGSKSDIIHVDIKECHIPYFIPNTFTPNKDGVNGFFEPMGRRIDKYTLKVFNRWGEMIHESFKQPWTGDSAPDGVSNLKVEITDLSGKFYQEIGTIKLIR